MPQEHRIPVDGVEIAVYEWGVAQPDKRDILFAHATGFHARVWDQVIARLDGFHCWAIDLRGHGHSSKPPAPYDWHLFGSDISSVGSALGLFGAVAAGHSLGGHAITLAAATRPSLFEKLVLIDPVILPRDQYVGALEFEHFTAKRRREWASPEEMIERFKDRPPFNTWKPEALRDYAVYGLLPNLDGEGYVLACEPAFEAAIYNSSTAANIYPEIATIQIPVTVLRAAGQLDTSVFNLSASPTAPDLAAQFTHGEDVYLPQYGHFIPMEAPEVVAKYVREASAKTD